MDSLQARTITVVQLVMLVYTAAGVMDHVIIIPLLLRAAQRDAWVSVLITGAVLLTGALVLSAVCRNTAQMHLGQWLRQHVHPFIWYPLLSIIVLQLFVMSAITLRDTCFWAKTMYLPETPLVATVLVFATGCYFAARSGLVTIAISNGILLPIIVALGIFVALGNLPNKNYLYLRPVLEHGLPPVMHGVLFTGAAFSEVILVLFLQPFVRSKIRWYVLVIIAVGLIGLTIGPLIGAITEFGPYEAARQRYSPYEEWRLLTFKHFIEHVDFLSIYQWLAGAFIRISLAMFLLAEMFQPRSPKQRNWILSIAFAAAFVVAIYPISDETFSGLVSNLYLPISLICMVGLLLILFVLSWSFRVRGAR
ncbi:GerAB/ArcD/ProY family transporter [Alicyclobacillus ferrooxydans]|uniref:Uncharacterized protein n=1 Tax=Alicyclobacillus ferrooxydans TaxID=471514 RepID=A0A0P9CJB1_9BACL|nr:endospore germination permease [Alicyclobacillus ferrooxydans]KPV43099.1 hypothetical protein AN477_14300 [Alicyclobacillus ferrooxydans]